MENLRIVHARESKEFKNALFNQKYLPDDEFDSMEEKHEYYYIEFFHLSDYLSLHGDHKEDYNFIQVDDEIITNREILNKEIELAVERFYGENFKDYYTKIEVEGRNIKEDYHYYIKGIPIMWCRDNFNHCYYCYQYYKNL